MSRGRTIALLSSLLLGGCFAADSDAVAEDSFQDDDIPMGGCNTGTGGCGDESGGSRAPVGSSCDNTAQCVDGAVCVAPFEDGDPGALACQLGCIQTGDPASWCSDDSACCSGICGDRGECLATEPVIDGTTGGAEDGSTTGASTGASTGEATSGTTGTGGSTNGTTGDSTSGTTGGTTTGGMTTGGDSTSTGASSTG